MKIRALANGNVIDVDETQATELIDRGIYERVEDDESPSRDASARITPIAPAVESDNDTTPRRTAPRKKAPS